MASNSVDDATGKTHGRIFAAMSPSTSGEYRQIGSKAGQLLLHTRDTLPRVFRIARIENADDALFDPVNEVFVDREAIAVMCDLRQVDVKAPQQCTDIGNIGHCDKINDGAFVAKWL